MILLGWNDVTWAHIYRLWVYDGNDPENFNLIELRAYWMKHYSSDTPAGHLKTASRLAMCMHYDADPVRAAIEIFLANI